MLREIRSGNVTGLCIGAVPLRLMAVNAHPLEIRVLGPLEVLVDGAPLVVDTRKALAILVLLAVDARPYAREELAAMLWPEADNESARGALRRTLSVLRAGLGDRWLDVDRSAVSLPGAAVRLDLAEVDAAVASGDPDRLRGAARRARGPFLAGFTLRDSVEFDDWRAARASAAERRVAEVLDRLADAAAAAGDAAGALEAARRRVAHDPLDEVAHRRLMRRLAADGDRGGAIQQYRTLVGILERELGVAPLAETTALYEAIRDGTLAPVVAVAGTHAEPTSTPAARAAEPGVDRPVRLPLVGRDPVLARLVEAHAWASPDGRVSVLEGEAGVGKSRLADELAALVAAKGGRVLAARAHAAESGLALAAIAALIRAGLELPDAAGRLGALPAHVAGEVDRLVPMPGHVRDRDRDEPVRESPAARLRFVEALADALVALAAGPVPGVVRVDDLHWADESSLEVLLYLARRLEGRPILLLAAWRPEDLDGPAAAAAERLRELAGARVEVLDRLGSADVRALVEASGATPALADALVAESEGLPLYVVEALAAGSAGGRVPRGMRALLRERLGRVGETAGQVLTAASVIGRSFDFGAVRPVAGRTEDETLDALEELVRRGLLREQADGGWDFTHGRLREAAYEAASLARRRILHRRVADALRARPGRDADLDGLVQIARHERDAGREAEAADAYREAGIRARRLFAHPEATDAFEAALALGHPDVVGLHEALAEVRMVDGDYAGAIASLEAAAALAPDERLASIELRLGQVHARRGDVVTAASHLEAAMVGLGDPSTDRRARECLVERSVVTLRAGDLKGARAMAGRAREAAEAAGDATTTGLALRISGLVARERGDLAAARDALERSLEIASAGADPAAAIAAGNALALVQAASGDREGAVDRLLAARDTAARTGERHLEAAIENNLADQLHALGRADDAMTHLRRAVALFADIGGRPGELEPEIWKLVAW